MQPAEIQKELDALHALGAEVIQRTSRLKQKLAPVQGPASRKGQTPTQKAVERRNKRMLK